jgi:hypothetical protein
MSYKILYLNFSKHGSYVSVTNNIHVVQATQGPACFTFKLVNRLERIHIFSAYNIYLGSKISQMLLKKYLVYT